ncbi:GNAT family N-acetyltransferase [Quadrisphaera sp. DSM 44207]|uniref:GNAT family N-acetyltransferase n=1 Tax=Quadrisphaera sp. DSM 44207 TaxID=1881057 RepID=UPI00088C9EB4|nr:GNAT family N-acetyltransferase [Quadrisphaera sp. DSM 44207]SDQ23330.1 Acetyltransferase (GNAT) family protein [Quadrisphaera sp. DSM 44207]
MSRRMVPLTLEALPELPAPCRRCVVWELDPVAARRVEEDGGAAFEKEAWLSGVLLGWGTAGRLAYVDDELAGFLAYAPPVHVPRSLAFPTSPVSADAVLLMGGQVVPAHRGGGLARMLVQGVAKDLTQRGVRALEAFGVTEAALRAGERPRCVVPSAFLEAVGFTVVRDHARYPRLRLELRTALSWREDVEAALERILATVRVPALSGTGATSRSR